MPLPALMFFRQLYLFDIIPIRVIDLVEIAVGAYVLYKLYMLMRGTIAIQIFLGLGALFLIQQLAVALDMTMLPVLFEAFNGVIVLAIIILFQPEIRRLLLLLGQNPLIRRFVRSSAEEEITSEIVEAVQEMSTRHIGALLVFERSTGLRSYIETGQPLQARVSRDLLITIFYSQNPLHDGAVIIRSPILEAARCILPVSSTTKLPPNLGLRHRAAIGITEQTDALVIVVSEETGRISVAQNGHLESGLQPKDLRSYLEETPTLTEDTSVSLTPA